MSSPATDILEPLERLEVRFARSADGLLRPFNDAGVLAAADVHVASRLAALAGERDDVVRLAVALAVRAPRLGHVHVDLASIRETAAVESDEAVELAALPWPEAADWRQRVAASSLVAVGEDDPAARPLRLLGTWLYLDRYWIEEREVAGALRRMSAQPALDVDEVRLAAGLERLYAGGALAPDDRQRAATETAVRRRLSVIAGGPGTGKTTTVARIVALLGEQAAGRGERPPLVALAAPTGKAAARLQQAVQDETVHLPIDPAVRDWLSGLEASTLHRLLGRRPGTGTPFRHDRRRHLPHDVVIVDETSMVPLSLMARLIEALRPGARLVLVGDPGQLASIEAGAVLGDIVGPASADGIPPGPLAGAIVVLDREHRFGGGIAALAEAVRRGDADRTVELLRQEQDEIAWVELDTDPGEAPGEALLEPLRSAAGQAAADVAEAARAGDAHAALAALGRFRLLCAHRRGTFGVSVWSARVESWLAGALPDLDADERWYAGRPLLITENDYELGLYNGDTGVIVARPEGRVVAAFERRGTIAEFSPTRLGAVDTLFAMTIHKSQGSQFGTAAVLLPEPSSRILSRELLYTAVTRARERLVVASSEAAIRAAVDRPIARASGLRSRLWTTRGDSPTGASA
jgi:exodeoxyribonuclease V alpha subunit